MKNRAQLVLTAAAVVAVALAPAVFAYLQLGYSADVAASGDYDAPVGNAQRVLSRGVHGAATGIPSSYRWNRREAAISAVRASLQPTIDALRSSRVESGTVYQVAYNRSAAQAWGDERCATTRGPNRQFGACEASRGIVVQNRTGETHVLAAAFDVHVTTERGRNEVTVIVPYDDG
ncbi:hypothetical protein ZOD2009_17193 [Haladaptatus paucihalophilus DX253]|uniref:Uncharacterized protein n=1 Tax=Haladaptatus paucihalophilus DX253 TaxID=797209 RepID=E7QXA0_HALPU|nr:MULTISPECIES: hypothetical protein [Haladaptatus]EFW90903.1 hypothetical protein ZOD2009_17193 [Haladaptatus paucihalophilus DX253]ODR83208.1 hypothetical protein BG842_12750 [Haladaptatus sp. W1]SHK25583.1 hypothetical protein SAMN05444342_1119 [Haladaptatus paucihalophilus DX253]